MALARALAVRPRVLLLDEPFGALDSRVRKDLRRWLRQLHDELHITSIFVTHDQEEALELADRVVVMNQGQIEQVGTPEQVYHEPATRFVYEFLGDVNIFHERAEDSRHGGIYVRPHAVDISRRPIGDNAVSARVQRVHVAGPTVKVEAADGVRRSRAGGDLAGTAASPRTRARGRGVRAPQRVARLQRGLLDLAPTRAAPIT